LLDNVSQLVSDQTAPVERRRVEVSASEHYVATMCIRQRIERLCRLSSVRVCMQPHVAEVVTEVGLKLGADSGRQRLPASFEPSEVSGSVGSRLGAPRCALGLDGFRIELVLALRAHAKDGTTWNHRLMNGNRLALQNSVRDTVRLAFGGVVRLGYGWARSELAP
jgi:hypothetical protein